MNPVSLSGKSNNWWHPHMRNSCRLIVNSNKCSRRAREFAVNLWLFPPSRSAATQNTLVTEVTRRVISAGRHRGCWVMCGIWLGNSSQSPTTVSSLILSALYCLAFPLPVYTLHYLAAIIPFPIMGLGNGLVKDGEKSRLRHMWTCLRKRVWIMKAAIVPVCSLTCPPVGRRHLEQPTKCVCCWWGRF